MLTTRSKTLACSIGSFVLAAFIAVPLASAQAGSTGGATPAQSSANTHLYRVSVFRAAPGRIADLQKLLTAQAPPRGSGEGDFGVVFRHRQGQDWDFMVVEHMGEKATIDLTSGPAPQPDSPLSQSAAWHGDTFAAGPPLDVFRRALNLQGATAQGGSGVYVISDYMAAAGHRGALQKTVNEIAADSAGKTVTLAHVEGAPWNFLAITRYDSWQQFAQEEEEQSAQASKTPTPQGPGMALREHLAVHHDTLATVQAVIAPK